MGFRDFAADRSFSENGLWQWDEKQGLAMLVISGRFSAFGACPSSAVLPSAKIIFRPLSR
jgi:hypothetical protein